MKRGSLKLFPVILAFFLLAFVVIPSASFAQDSTPAPTPSNSPSPTATPDPNSTPTPTPSSQATSSAQGKVLGDATKLGGTSRYKIIGQWVLGLSIGILAFLIGIKISRSRAEE